MIEQQIALPHFHLAFVVSDLEQTRSFYVNTFECTIGRESAIWIDFDFFGHQITAHLGKKAQDPAHENPVDGDSVPVPHFGVILSKERWEKLADRIRARNIPFIIEPKIRFEGEPGEQGTFFLADPDGHALEFKTFASESKIFETEK